MESKAIARRDFLKMAASMGLSFIVPGMGYRAAQVRGQQRPKSLITIWLGGGASQLETWDPHPGSAVGGPTRAINTSLREVQIAEHYPLLAGELQHLSVIRSLVSREGDHMRGMYFLKTGYRPDPTIRHPSLGAIVSREIRSPGLEIPSYITLGDDIFGSAGGYLGGRHDAFRVRFPGGTTNNLRTPFRDERQRRRLDSLDVMSREFSRGRRVTADRTLHQHTVQAALQMMTSEQLQSFDIENEPAKVRDDYGHNEFGRGCLVARRLVEQGVRAVDITLRDFDSHRDNFSVHRNNAAILDPALTTLIKDLRQRDLYDSTMVLCVGEFGRTPRINVNDGRDHWPNGFSCLIGGGGLRAGVLIGATDPTGERREPEDPIQVPDLYATILRTLGINSRQENMTHIGRPIRYSEGRSIDRLMPEV